MGNLDDMRLPLTILLGALIIGGIVGAVGISMQPKFDDSRLEPITGGTDQHAHGGTATESRHTAAPPGNAASDADQRGIAHHRHSRTATCDLRSDRDDRRWGTP